MFGAYRRALLVALLTVFVTTATEIKAQSTPADRTVQYSRDVLPILSDNCFRCHGPDAKQRRGKLRLDDETNAKGKREGDRVLVPGKPEKSGLYLRITSKDRSERMPPRRSKKLLTADQIEVLRRWIKQGAEYQPHWSFAALTRPPIPEVEDDGWTRNPIDRFVLRAIERNHLSASPQADRITMIRRLYFDLLGLPPTPEQVDQFDHDPLPNAYERLVDRLLASPHFGERMAIYWLDLVRYADSVGYHGDQEHNASHYREYVIHSYNQNKPFDQFTIEQLAGDLLPNPTIDQKIATAYNRILQTSHEGGVQDKEYLNKYAADRVRNVSAVWMGATMGCCECHNHKFDPYAQEDFYSLKAFFADVEEKGKFAAQDRSPTQRAPEISVLSLIERRKLEQIEARLSSLPPDDQRRSALTKEKQEIHKRARKVMVTVSAKPRITRVLNRGDWMDTSGKIVEPAIPHSMGALRTNGKRATRLDLAKWLTAPDHPQTSRVLVNRLWYLFFGAGLSRTLDDSGTQGEWPTHPELLDWLAAEMVQSGWDVKHVVRLLVTSSTYRQSSRSTEEQRERDPENRLYARQSRFRLPAEMVRDNALSVSGLLVDRIGGPSARPYQPKGYYRHLNFPKRTYKADQDEGQYRRGVYVHWQRQFLHPMMRALDAPSREECTAGRPISNTPLAALALLNDPTFVEAARVLATRTLREGGDTVAKRIEWTWRTVLSRRPAQRELAVLERLYRMSKEEMAAVPKAAPELLHTGLSPLPTGVDAVELATWTTIARAILNLNETMTRN